MPPTKGARQSKGCRICEVVPWPASPPSSAETPRLWQNCCNWCTLENGEAINSQTELEVEAVSELGLLFYFFFSVLLVMNRILISLEKQHCLVREFNSCRVLPYFYLPPSKIFLPLFSGFLICWYGSAAYSRWRKCLF